MRCGWEEERFVRFSVHEGAEDEDSDAGGEGRRRAWDYGLSVDREEQ